MAVVIVVVVVAAAVAVVVVVVVVVVVFLRITYHCYNFTVFQVQSLDNE